MTAYPDTIPSLSLVTSGETARGYAALTQDWNPIHLDADFARRAGFEQPIAHGTMALNLVIQAVDIGSGGALRIADMDIRFTAPTRIGQTLATRVSRDGGARYAIEVVTDDGCVVLKGQATLAVRAGAV
jgi:acyl dehydratase